VVYQLLGTGKYEVKFAPVPKMVQQRNVYSNGEVADVLAQAIRLLNNKPTVQIRDILYYNFRSLDSVFLDILWKLAADIPEEEYKKFDIINIANPSSHVVQFQISNNPSEDKAFKLRHLFEIMKDLVSQKIAELGREENIDTEAIIHRALANAAMIGHFDTTKGGIDLSMSNVNWIISKDGNGVEMNIDSAMIKRIKRDGIDSLTPVIFRITPIQSIWPIIGLEPPKQEERLAVL
jgi:hypothetical protein